VAEHVGRDADLLGGTVDQLGDGAIAEEVRPDDWPNACRVRASICVLMAAFDIGPPERASQRFQKSSAAAGDSLEVRC
jgi:hypothetical protein